MKENKKRTIFSGAATALVTPMDTDGSIDYIAFNRLIEFQIESGIDALVFLGTTGEASTLTDKEKIKCIDFAVKAVGGRVPVIVGTGSNDTNKTVSMSEYAAKNGVDALLVVTPYYNKATNDGLVRHYITVADAVDVPIIVYNVPSRTGVNVTPSVYRKLVSDKRICAVKEASGNLSQVADIISEFGDRLDVYSGCDDLTLPTLSLGGKGVISVTSNIIPKDVHDMCEKHLCGDTNSALQLHNKMLPLCRAVFSEVNPIPIKRACELLKICGGTLRLPLTKMSENNTEKLREVLINYGLI